MHFKVIFRTLAIMILVLDIFILACAFVGLYFGEWKAVKSFLVSALFSGLLSGATLWLLRGDKQKTLSTRDGFLLVVLCWFTASVIGSFPYLFEGGHLSITDAFFETVSGFSTTGATIFTDVESLPYSILLWRSLTLWLGGMGIIVLGVAILPLLGIGGMQLMRAEVPGPGVEKITPRITETAKYLWYIYIGFTVAEMILLMFGGMSFFDSVNHSLSTVATGGFSVKNQSITYYNSEYIDYVVTVFMLLSGISFTMHFRILSGHFKVIKYNTELKAYLTIFVLATGGIAISLYGNVYDTAGESLRYAAFHAASFLTTTAFYASDYEQWTFLGQFVLLMLMFVGGCSGSTAGGIKVIRMVTLFKQSLVEMKYLIYPRGVFMLRINNSPIGKNIVYAVSGFFFLYFITVFTVTTLLAASGLDLLTSFSAGIASVSNIGTGFGGVGPSGTFASMPDHVKWILSFAMMVGRLELYTVFVILTPAFWKR